MKFFLDNNLSPKVAKALDALFGDEHSVVHLREKFAANTLDVEWISQLAKEGNWAIVSRDRFTKNNNLEKEALRRSGLIVFTLTKSWGNAQIPD